MNLGKDEHRNVAPMRNIRYQQQSRSTSKKVVTTMLVAVPALWLWLAHLDTVPSLYAKARQDSEVSRQPPTFDWESIKTNSDLQYTTCYEYLQCARLELPMDWFNQTTNETISLAVIRQPAVVPVTHSQYGGAILLNPGGPGGSGVGLMLLSGEHARSVVDTNTTEGKYFDLISFDPRGVGVSKPRVDCFHDPNVARNWQQRVQEEGWFESSDAALGRLWSMSTAKGHGCSEYSGYNGDDIKQYVSTASAARDMLELVEKHGEWREREAKHMLRGGCPYWRHLKLRSSKRIDVPAALQYKHGREKIQYYGVSYGSYLGGTFAAMFPDRVERLAVDGVIEYDNYKSGNWSSNLIDTEKTMDSFYFHCARAGYPACFLSNEANTSTPAEIKNRTNSIIDSLYHNPLPVYTPSPDVLSYSEIKSLVFSSLYNPVLLFPFLAFILLAIEQKNDSSTLAQLARIIHPSACAADSPASIYETTADAQIAIVCSDGDDQSYLSRSDFQSFAQELAHISPSTGSIWSTIRMNCVHYTLPAVHRFTGPWKANTSHPLLFIGNTADPVTPGLFARKMAEGFEGAVALMQDSGGHCSHAAFSWCTQGYMRRYFQTGELPPVNTTCAADVIPFGPLHGPDEDGAMVVEAEEVRTARERWEKMAEASLEHGASPGGRVWHRLRQIGGLS